MNKNTKAGIVIVGIALVLYLWYNQSKINLSTKIDISNPEMKKTAGDGFNNPGNIRQSPIVYIGEIVNPFNYFSELVKPNERNFKSFTTMAYGFRAMIKILRAYNNRGLVTLRQMINTYAPPSDNNPTESYVSYVQTKSGIADADADITELVKGIAVKEIIRHMAEFEQGAKFGQSIKQSDLDTAYNLA